MMTNSYRRRVAAVSMCSTILALGFALPAAAQTAPNEPLPSTDQQADSGAGDIVVTGTRVDRSGYESPTPVTSLSGSAIERNGATAIADDLNRLPQFGSPVTSNAGFQGGAAGGANYLSLRDLGSGRTLVLLNGERIVPSTLTNDVNINTLPMTLIKRVDVVTGGASAAYGSDAVAGVVNFILDTKFQGLKASVQYRNRTDGGYPGYKADLAFGTRFGGDRGHLIVSGSYFNNPDFFALGQAPWNKGTALVLNPAYTPTNTQPRLIHADHLGQAVQSVGGVITSGPLAGIIFTGPNATPTPYNPGQISGVIATGGNADPTALNISPIGLTQHALDLFGYTDYELGAQITAHVEVSYGTSGGESAIGEYQRANNITIKSDNPYIPDAIRTQMANLGITSFLLGSNNTNLGNPRTGGVIYPNDRTFLRVAAGLDGKFGKGWSWNVYYQHGSVDTREKWLNDVYIPYYNLAIDAVTAPAGNSAGIAPGTIVCRSTLTNPGNGCQPLNLFGVGVASPQAVKYITPVPFTEVDLRQDVVSASLQGEPFSTWAGPVSLALGAEYRRESGVSYSDALTYTRSFAYGNALPFSGSVNVKEAFAETVIPLVRDQSWARELDLNGAIRVTDYSTSGRVVTWKVGFTNDIASQYRVRATVSRDIRAPNLSELFTQAISGGRAVADPFNPGQTPSILATTRGNPNLKPEDASTVTAGFVATPDWLRGFTASIDYYHIKIKGAIATVSAEDELRYCFQGNQDYCSLIRRDANGVLAEIFSVPTNTAAQTTSGIDVNAQYVHRLGGGTLNLDLRTNYRFENKIVQNGVVIDNAGSLSRATVGGAGQPKFKATASVTYDQGPFSGTIQTRIIGAGKLVSTWTAKDVDNNDVPAIGYIDLRGSFDVTKHFSFFAAIDNLFDKAPPSVPQAFDTPTVYYTPGTGATVYDLLGRQFTVGLRAKF